MNPITLYELNNQIKLTLKNRFADTFWITAEITEIQNNSSGHCYLQLADKKEEDGSIVAVARATIWAFTYRMLKPYFETTTGRSLAKGMKVLINVEVVFHEVYGYSLNIKDIDPTFTIGDLERKKREIIGQLEKEGIINMNKELEFPILPKKIAVISSSTAAGYGDFINQLQTNPYGYCFWVKLFPAIMQGDRTTESVIAALDRIYEYENLFDVVVIIRGGGSQTDLGCFDTYDMAANVAQFPLPVIAGIGHERDETIVDRVAYLKVKTPTAAAAFLIQAFHEQEGRIDKWKNDFVAGITCLMNEEHQKQLLYISGFKQSVQVLLANKDTRLQLLSQKMEHTSKLFMANWCTGFENIKTRLNNKIIVLLEKQLNTVENYIENVRQKSRNVFAAHKHELELAETKMKYVDPLKILERGFSITRLNGKAIKNIQEIKTGDVLETRVVDGKIKSVVMASECR